MSLYLKKEKHFAIYLYACTLLEKRKYKIYVTRKLLLRINFDSYMLFAIGKLLTKFLNGSEENMDRISKKGQRFFFFFLLCLYI